MLSAAQVSSYNGDGYLHVKGLFDREEVELLNFMARNDPSLKKNALARDNGQGGETRLALWSSAGDDFFGMITRGDRLVTSVEQLVGEQVYHWHSKMIMKEPKVGGAWNWHQDYGYWYNDKCLFPKLISVFIAIDKSTRENGCLQVLRGSHNLGRIDHVRIGQQTGAEPERVDAACQQLETVYAEMEPGDALYFHCNTLHRSDANLSDKPRWGLICCYNAGTNSPYGQTWQSTFKPIEKVPNNALKEARDRFMSESDQFLRDGIEDLESDLADGKVK